MTRYIGYIHGLKLEPFSPPSVCQSGHSLQEYLSYGRTHGGAHLEQN
jgi:hypothetical protein